MRSASIFFNIQLSNSRDMFKLTVYIDYNLDLKTQEKLLKLFMNFERKNRRTKKYIKSKKKLEKIIQ